MESPQAEVARMLVWVAGGMKQGTNAPEGNRHSCHQNMAAEIIFNNLWQFKDYLRYRRHCVHIVATSRRALQKFSSTNEDNRIIDNRQDRRHRSLINTLQAAEPVVLIANVFASFWT
jgi:hypothetical protein